MDPHANLLANLESAIDVRKMMSVFSSLVGILKEQQTKIDELATRGSSSYDARIAELEKKVDEIELFTKGGGFADDSVLHENTLEVSPFLAFRQASMFAGRTALDDEDDEQPNISSARSKRPSIATINEDVKKEEEELSEVKSRVPSSKKPSRRASPLPSNTSRQASLRTSPRVQEEIEKVEQLLEEVKDTSLPDIPQDPVTEEPIDEEIIKKDEVEAIEEIESNIESEEKHSIEKELETTKEDGHEDIKEDEVKEEDKPSVEQVDEGVIEHINEVENEQVEAQVDEQKETVEVEPDLNLEHHQHHPSELNQSEEQLHENLSVEDSNPQFTANSSEALIQSELSHTKDEEEIGEVKDLPHVAPEASDPSNRRRSRNRAIPDFRPNETKDSAPESSHKSMTRKSIHPNEMPKEIHHMYGTPALPIKKDSHSARNSRRSTPHVTPRTELRTVQLARRKMTVDNLPFLTPEKCKKILQDLKMRGRFLRISRDMMEEQRKKYSTQSLKQKIDYLEAEIIRISTKLDKLKDNTKKNNISIKEGFSFIKQQNDNFHSQLSALEDDLQQLVYRKRAGGATGGSNGLSPELMKEEAVMKLISNAANVNEVIEIISKTGGQNPFAKLLQMNSSSRLLTTDNFMDEMIPTMINYLKMNLIGPELHPLQEKLNQYHHKLQSITADSIPRNELITMLGGSPTSSTDPNHMKLMNLINKTIITSQERLETIFDEKLQKVLSSSMLLNAMNNGDGSQGKNGALHGLPEGIQKVMNEWKEEVTKKLQDSHLKTHRLEEDLLFVKDQIHYLELFRIENMTELQKMEKARQVEAEQLKILQKRISNLSVDKLLDDLRSVHKQLLEKPTTEQVSQMMENIENTFKEHLGENVNGLKSLVHQVYRHIQHKVDREDIRKLIASRLAQMEKEIITREEELYQLASTTRCLSCGQLPRESWQGAGGSVGGSTQSKKQSVTVPPSRQEPFSPPTRAQTTGGPPPPLNMQDSFVSQVSLESLSPHENQMLGDGEGAGGGSVFMTSDASGVNPYSLKDSEQVYALLTGQAGLRPIQLQHPPMLPVSRPHTTASGAASGSSTARQKRGIQGEKIPDPVYRKAKLSAHVKEMVKVSAPALDQYGYNSVNPLYVLEGGSVSDQGDNSSIGSHRNLIGSHSLTSLPASSATSGSYPSKVSKSMIGEFVMMNDPRAIKATSSTNKRTHANNPEVLILPDIHSSSNGISSKPNSPESRGDTVGTSSSTYRRGGGSVIGGEPQIHISQMKLSSYI